MFTCVLVIVYGHINMIDASSEGFCVDVATIDRALFEYLVEGEFAVIH
jgi:hypothetical protein